MTTALRGEGAVRLRDQAYESFTDRLLSQDLKPGQFVSQRELVTLTGYPLAAIRELVPRLESDGLIVAVPQRGLYVAPIDMQLIRNAFQFRLMVERECAAAFAQNGSADAIAALRASHEAVRDAAAGGVGPALIQEAQDVDWQLHDTVVQALNNDIIWNHFRVNMIKIRLIRQQLTRLDASLVVPVMEEHLAIIAAIETRNPVHAGAAMALHIENARNRAMAG